MKSTNDVVERDDQGDSAASAGSSSCCWSSRQFLAYFNYTNMSTIAALSLADALQNMNLNALWLLIGFVIVVFVLDLIITGAIPKWACSRRCSCRC